MAAKKPETKIETTGVDVGEALVLLAKALTSKRGGIELADRAQLTKTGDFTCEGVLMYRIAGNIGKDYDSDKFDGVKIDTVLNMLMAVVPGFTADYIRKSIAVSVELWRAEKGEREVADITWTDDAGVVHPLPATEIKALSEKAAERQSEAKEMTAPLAKLLKTKKPCDGPVNIHEVTLDVRPNAPVIQPLSKAA